MPSDRRGVPEINIEPGQTWTSGLTDEQRFIVAVHRTTPIPQSTVKIQSDDKTWTMMRVGLLAWIKRHGAVCS